MSQLSFGLEGSHTEKDLTIATMLRLAATLAVLGFGMASPTEGSRPLSVEVRMRAARGC